jgi:predicted secreted protein|tara:strand:- start:12128 stop:12508 length:381 start_codon:yes stop_codon:yes gene_type:complete
MAAVTANGTTLTVDSQVIGNVLSVSAVNVTVATIDSTDLDSSWRTFIGGLKDGGECSFELAYDPSNSSHQGLEADIDGASKAVIVTWSDSTTCTFSAIITSFAPSAAIDDKLTVSIGMKITGAITF